MRNNDRNKSNGLKGSILKINQKSIKYIAAIAIIATMFIIGTFVIQETEQSDADLSDKTLYVNGAPSSLDSVKTAEAINTPWAFSAAEQASLVGHPINYVTFIVSVPGEFTIAAYSTIQSTEVRTYVDDNHDNEQIIGIGLGDVVSGKIRTVSVSEVGLQTVYFREMTIAEGEYLAIAPVINGSGKFAVVETKDTSGASCSYCKQLNKWFYCYTMGCDVGYSSSFKTYIEGLPTQDQLLPAGTTKVSPKTQPWIFSPNEQDSLVGKKINYIQLNAKTTGNLTIGAYVATPTDESIGLEKVSIGSMIPGKTRTVTIEKTGVQYVTFPELILSSGQYLGVGVPGDSVVWELTVNDNDDSNDSTSGFVYDIYIGSLKTWGSWYSMACDVGYMPVDIDIDDYAQVDAVYVNGGSPSQLGTNGGYSNFPTTVAPYAYPIEQQADLRQGYINYVEFLPKSTSTYNIHVYDTRNVNGGNVSNDDWAKIINSENEVQGKRISIEVTEPGVYQRYYVPQFKLESYEVMAIGDLNGPKWDVALKSASLSSKLYFNDGTLQSGYTLGFTIGFDASYEQNMYVSGVPQDVEGRSGWITMPTAYAPYAFPLSVQSRLTDNVVNYIDLYSNGVGEISIHVYDYSGVNGGQVTDDDWQTIMQPENENLEKSFKIVVTESNKLKRYYFPLLTLSNTEVIAIGDTGGTSWKISPGVSSDPALNNLDFGFYWFLSFEGQKSNLTRTLGVNIGYEDNPNVQIAVHDTEDSEVRYIRGYAMGSLIPAPESIDENLVFAGWYDNSDFLGKSVTVITESGDYELFAKYVDKKTYDFFNGKVVSVIGDSISSFEGVTPTGYANYYPRSNLNITSSDQMWWSYLISDTGAEYGVIDAYSGSNSRGSVGSSPSSKPWSDDRVNNVGSNGNPDIIVILFGINDASASAENLHFDPTKPYARSLYNPTKTNDGVEGYAAMINRLMANYPEAQIVIVEPFYGVGATYATGADYLRTYVREIADYYGIISVDPQGVLQQNGLGSDVYPNVK